MLHRTRVMKPIGSLAVLVIIFLSLAVFAPRAPLASGATTPSAGIAIPLYTDPPGGGWSGVLAAKEAYPSVPFVAIINPSNGPGRSSQSDYVTGIENFQAAGITVLGYIDTYYSSASTSSVESQVKDYYTWYHVNGIFFDEDSNTANYESYYSGLSQYVYSLGMTQTFGNPGNIGPTGYIGTTNVIGIYEDNGLPSISSITNPGYAPSNFYVIADDVSSLSTSFLTQAAGVASWFYMTNLGGSNPYDGLPSYFTSEVAALAAIDGGSVSGTTTITSSSSATAPPTTTSTTVSSTTTITTSTASSTSTNSTTTRGGTASVTVNSVNVSGATLSGECTTWGQGTRTLSTGYTPDTFSGTVGGIYVLNAYSYRDNVFCYWQGGSTNPAQTLTLSGNTVLTVYYSTTGSCPTGTTTTTTRTTSTTTSTTTTITSTNPSPSRVTITVQSDTLAGVAVSGMRVTVKSGGNTVDSGYTGLSFTATVGVTYQISMSSYGQYVFNHWNTGATSATQTITPTQSMTLTAYYSTDG